MSRGNERERVETLARYVQVGILSSDEARAREDLGRVPDGWGKMPRMQAQNVPLDAVAAVPTAPHERIEAPTIPSAPSAPSAHEARSRPRIRRVAGPTADSKAWSERSNSESAGAA